MSPDKPDSVTFVANWVPFELPAGGPNFNKFGDDVLYKVNVDNNGDAGRRRRRTSCGSQTKIANGNTFLYNTGPIESIDDRRTSTCKQSYTVTEVRGGKRTTLVDNAAGRAREHRAPVDAQLRPARGGGGRRRAGRRQVVRRPARRPVLRRSRIGVRPRAGCGRCNGAHAIQASERSRRRRPGRLQRAQRRAPGADHVAVANNDPVIGVWSTTEPPDRRVFGNGKVANSGKWVQVSRLGMPLVNEVVDSAGQRRTCSTLRSRPKDDGSS